ncbi:putative vesicular-fusion protein sec17 -like protein [Ceratocystis fimbriata CBS 114723]|uniref:Putative vesicular-fusion protein sec17-like protein n=1 Tax=Ceratocystis fimbriata CBS 114723 TaxID=1035309 RepID=A0A2C5WUY0_9PEZI|nr:putative vesicular-fusion protein sec17 -like protein [Ceratocystis fimbriata CBS 114723]
MSDPHVLLKKATNARDSAEKSFNFFGRRNELYSNAADLFIQAGNTFRLQKLNIDAGKALEEAAKIQEQHLQDPDDAANTRLDAFKAYRTDDPAAAARCVELAIRQYCSRGNFRRAAGHQEALAEIYDTRLGNTKAALEAYEQAAGWYEGDNAPAMANKIWLKVAEMAAVAKDYHKATDIFERVAKGAVDNNLMQYSVKDYLFKAGICHLASGDNVATQRALDEYVEIDKFGKQREYHILRDLFKAVQESNVEEFVNKLYLFDQVSRLDRWKTAILTRVKDQIDQAPVDADEDEFA